MKRLPILPVAVALAGVLTAGSTLAADVDTLLKDGGCLSCHASHEKIVGPAFVKIAAKYAGQSDAVDTLAQSVRNGSSGKWGRAAMPAHANMSDGDIKALVTWVLATKP